MPGTAGARLAAAFGRSLEASGVDLSDADELDQDQLRRLGEVCGLDRFAQRAKDHATVADELRETRAALLDWSAFEQGRGPTGPRILSIGIILKLHELAGGLPVDLSVFRSATLLGQAELSDERQIELSLPPIYDVVLGRWRMYQAHAYATLALESMLALLLQLATEASAQGTFATIERIVRTAVGATTDTTSQSEVGLPPELAEWHSMTVAAIARGPWQDLHEPVLAWCVREEYWNDGPALAHDASLLLVVSILRMRQLREGGDTWTGHEDPARLPPTRLLAVFERFERQDAPVADFLAYVMEHLVLHQHRTNALRKLLSQPGTDSARFARSPNWRFGAPSPRAVDLDCVEGWIPRLWRDPSTTCSRLDLQ